MSDPAVLFYTSDFLTGCIDLTMEERGQYITMLCLQHQKGHLSEKTIRLSIGSVSVDVLNKFSKDEAGNYFNERMNREIENRHNFVNSRRINGLKGGRPKKENEEIKPIGKPIGLANEKLIEDENGNIIINKKELTTMEQILKNLNKPEKIWKDYFLNLLPVDSKQDFIEKWVEWVDYRKEIRKKLSESTAKQQIKKLLNYNNPIFMINRTIEKGWIGLPDDEPQFNNTGNNNGHKHEQTFSIKL